jgi:chromosome segregation ATPase
MLGDQVADRAVYYGVYSGAYLHGHSYLVDISYETLAQMVRAFDQNMAALTADEQRVIIDIAAKRYAHDRDMAAKDAALDTKRKKVDLKAAEVDAKMEALEADRAALETKRIELSVAIRKASTRVLELQGRIEEQALETETVEAEIEKQRLLQKRAELDALETAVRALEIQAQIADAAYRLAIIDARKDELGADIARINLDAVEVDVRKSQLTADTAHLTVEAAKENLVEYELQADRAEKEAYALETDIAGPAKRGLIARKVENVQREGEIVTSLGEAIESEKAADMTAQSARTGLSISEQENRTEVYKIRTAVSDEMTAYQEGADQAEKTRIMRSIDYQVAYDSNRIAANRIRNEGAAEAADIIRTANIINTLTHQIGGAP